ncbi:MAG: hypothetical protein ACYDCL_06970 [Myxococcales bacterium]
MASDPSIAASEGATRRRWWPWILLAGCGTLALAAQELLGLAALAPSDGGTRSARGLSAHACQGAAFDSSGNAACGSIWFEEALRCSGSDTNLLQARAGAAITSGTPSQKLLQLASAGTVPSAAATDCGEPSEFARLPCSAYGLSETLACYRCEAPSETGDRSDDLIILSSDGARALRVSVTNVDPGGDAFASLKGCFDAAPYLEWLSPTG